MTPMNMTNRTEKNLHDLNPTEKNYRQLRKAGGRSGLLKERHTTEMSSAKWSAMMIQTSNIIGVQQVIVRNI